VSDDDACARARSAERARSRERGAARAPSLFMMTKPLKPLFFFSSRITSSTSFIWLPCDAGGRPAAAGLRRAAARSLESPAAARPRRPRQPTTSTRCDTVFFT